MNDDPFRHSCGESGGNLLIACPAHKTKFQNFALAGVAHGQGKRNGDKRMGIKALGVLDLDTGTGESALEGTHQIQMRNVLGTAGFRK